jgi:tRNA U34 5-carboxymethylaminomethyl modifying GTPase MnmE/TrmE
MKKIAQSLNSMGFAKEADLLEGLILCTGDPRFRIANAGPMNPGKSSLFNAIFEQDELFATADHRLTSKCQEEEYHKSFCFIDTPGCNSSCIADEPEAERAFRSADLILFVHNISTGGLLKTELDILKYIKDVFGDEDFMKRVVFVGNRLDLLGVDEDEEKQILAANRQEIEKQLADNLQVSGLTFFAVSARYHFDGLKQKGKGNSMAREAFIAKGNIGLLRNHIQNHANTIGKRGQQQIQIVLNGVKQRQQQLSCKQEERKNKYRQQTDKSKQYWTEVLSEIKPFWESCR